MNIFLKKSKLTKSYRKVKASDEWTHNNKGCFCHCKKIKINRKSTMTMDYWGFIQML